MENGKESKGTASCGMNSDGSYNCDVVMKKCNYSKKDGGLMYCNFLCKTGHSRGGDLKHCFVFESKKRGRKSTINPFTGVHNMV